MHCIDGPSGGGASGVRRDRQRVEGCDWRDRSAALIFTTFLKEPTSGAVVMRSSVILEVLSMQGARRMPPERWPVVEQQSAGSGFGEPWEGPRTGCQAVSVSRRPCCRGGPHSSNPVGRWMSKGLWCPWWCRRAGGRSGCTQAPRSYLGGQ